jgi:hypothetical protein
MENPILDFTDTLAKRWRAHNAGAIAAAHACGLGPVFDFHSDDDERVKSAPVPSRRQRKRSIASTLRAARKAGADRVIVDGIVIALSPAAAVPESDANEWDTVLLEGDHGPN